MNPFSQNDILECKYKPMKNKPINQIMSALSASQIFLGYRKLCGDYDLQD